MHTLLFAFPSLFHIPMPHQCFFYIPNKSLALGPLSLSLLLGESKQGSYSRSHNEAVVERGLELSSPTLRPGSIHCTTQLLCF